MADWRLVPEKTRQPSLPSQSVDGSTTNGAPLEARIRAILAKSYWDYGEAALVLNLKVKSLRNMKYRREITFTHFGGKVYFPRQTILAELRRNMVACSEIARAERRKRAA